jgi:enediyne biosynthesis thioesterase
VSGYAYRHTVTFSDTNVVGNVYFARYLDWQGRCREMFLAEHARDFAQEVADGKLLLVTVSCEMEYFEECFPFDEVTLVMTPKEVAGNRISMRFSYRRGDAEVARGGQTVACMTRDGEGIVPVSIPRSLVEVIKKFEA